jgi:N-acetylglucosamine kinase-like BadF-type ATPase
MPEHALVGVDLGGTRIRVVASGGQAGRIDWSRKVQAQAPGLADLPRFLRRLWRRWGLSRREVEALVVAARGVWTARERRHAAGRLRGLAQRVRVISDAEAAFMGALGDGSGLLVLAGTGSIVLGRDRRGRWRRAGGLGPLLGDEGSAFWIGREWLRAASQSENLERARKLARASDAVTRTAALAPKVLREAKAGHRHARQIVAGAQRHLASLAGQVARELRLPRPLPVSWAGSLLGDRAFRAGLWRALKRQGITARAVVPARPPVVAAHALAIRLARGAKRSPASPRSLTRT